MKSIYSILQVLVNMASQEKLSLGLLFSDGGKMYFHFSREKLQVLRKLLPDNAYRLLKAYVEGLEKQINAGSLRFGEGYLSYLSNYNHNLVTFSAQAPIDLELNKRNFVKLFETMVFEFSEEEKKAERKIRTETLVKRELKPRIEQYVNWDIRLTATQLPNLLINSVKVNFLGRNEVPVAGEAIDFTLSTEAIDNKISQFVTLIKAFELNKEKGKYFVIGDQPAKADFPDQYSVWKRLKELEITEFVPVDELERIAGYVEEHEVRPFISPRG